MKNFPDWFFDKTDWQEKFVGDVCKIQTGTGNKQDKIDDGIYNFYVRSKKIEHSNKYIFDGEAVLTAGDGDIGKIFHYVDGKFNCHQRVYFLTDFKEVLGKYFYYYFSTKFYERVRKLSAKNTVDSVRMNMISEMKIKFPPLAVQKKIAEYFTSLDNAINAQDLKLKSWRDAKKAMLQKIFTQEFYFTDGNGEKYPAWQEKTLGEVGEIQDGTHGTFERTEEGDYLLSAKNISDNKLVITDNESKISHEDYKKIISNGFPAVGDILITCVGIIGRCCMLKEKIFAFQRSVAFIRSKKIYNEFLLYVLQSSDVQKQLFLMTNASVQGGIYLNSLRTLKIKLPCVEEQKKIADYFSSLDKIIDAENKILENLRLMKRGLLQKLFV